MPHRVPFLAFFLCILYYRPIFKNVNKKLCAISQKRGGIPPRFLFFLLHFRPNRTLRVADQQRNDPDDQRERHDRKT